MYWGGRSCHQYNEMIKSLTFIENLTKLVMQEMAQKRWSVHTAGNHWLRYHRLPMSLNFFIAGGRFSL